MLLTKFNRQFSFIDEIKKTKNIQLYNNIQKNYQYSDNSCSNRSSQIKYKNNQTVQLNQLSPAQKLRSTFAKYNNDILLPKCLQQTMKKKFNLSPLVQNSQKSLKSSFKLKNYCKFPQLNYDAPKQNYYQQLEDCKQNHQIQNTSYMRSTFVQQCNSQQNENKIEPFKQQLTNMLITQSKMKYTSRWKLTESKMRQTKYSKRSQLEECKSIDRNKQNINQSILNRTNSVLNFSSLSPRRKISTQGQERSELLNSTRTKLLCKMQKLNSSKLKKTDLFPLEKLLQQRKNKFNNFRSKWFQPRILHNQILQ